MSCATPGVAALRAAAFAVLLGNSHVMFCDEVWPTPIGSVSILRCALLKHGSFMAAILSL